MIAQAEQFSEAAQVGDCLSCPAGKQLNEVANGCNLCEPGTYRDNSVARCRDCKVGTFTAAHGALSCDACPNGQTTTDAGSIDCQCEIGRYSVSRSNESCTPCSSLTLPMPLFTKPPNLQDPATCPGGPNGDAPLCPMEGLWAHHDKALNKIQLFACESALACPGVANCSDWLVSRSVAAPPSTRRVLADSVETLNSCGPNNAGFRAIMAPQHTRIITTLGSWYQEPRTKHSTSLPRTKRSDDIYHSMGCFFRVGVSHIEGFMYGLWYVRG